ncbi:MAG TPA: 50S ribosomal protein L6 [Nitrosopumilaceae archaeon]|nr:50S ribosomal protein L6 [Nitrosopumilaceae archaeon]
MSTKQLEEFKAEVTIPEGVTVSLNKHMLQVQGPLGKTYKNFKKIPVELQVNDSKVSLKAIGSRKRDYAILNTAKKIIRNLCEGVKDGYTVKMKVIYAHFPITVKADKDKVMIENFQGERAPRIAQIVGNTKVNPKGEDVIITGPVLTDVTQTAANIESKTNIKNKDHRVFLDGIYVYEKNKGIESGKPDKK